jgi:hypothetical protein
MISPCRLNGVVEANFSDEEWELLALELEKRPDALLSCVILTNNANCALCVFTKEQHT